MKEDHAIASTCSPMPPTNVRGSRLLTNSVRDVRLYADETGQAHFEDLDAPLTALDHAPPAPPLRVSPFAAAVWPTGS